MSEPEIKFEIDEYGRIGYRVTNEGVLLSKEEKEFIISNILRMQEENAKLREQIASFQELSQDMVIYAGQNMERHFAKRLRKLGVPL